MSFARGVLATALLLCACATARELGSDGSPIYRTSEVDSGPRLMGCPGYDPPTVAYARGYAPVTVTFVVTANGFVEPGTVSLSSRSYRPEPLVQTRALSIARGCAYQPAMLNGETVAVRLSTTFRLETSGVR